jgi:DNA-binding CsgD family transcriptional regulator
MTREIPSCHFVSLNTTRNHVQRLIAKLGAHSRLEAVAAARRAGLLETAAQQ